MNRTIIKIKLWVLSFLITGSLMAQQKLTKVSQSIGVNKDVIIDLNTSYCNIIVDTWNKDTVEIEAYIEGNQLSKEEMEKALKSWSVDVDATKDEVSIKTTGSNHAQWHFKTNGHDENDMVNDILMNLKFELADLPEMPAMPEMPPMPPMPELPELPEGVHNFNFDYDAYEKKGEKYLEEYTKQFESRFGKDFEKKMEAWGEKFGEEWGKTFGKQMEAWAKQFESKMNGEEYAKRMEAWEERFEKQMEGQTERIASQAERMAAQAERSEAQKERAMAHKEQMKEREKLLKEREKKMEVFVNGKSNTNVKKTIKIKIPKKAKLKVNVRHGEIEFAANVDDLKADLSHAKFKAYSINGSSTSINASYSPVFVTNWNLGELNLNYVKNAELENVSHLVLNAISSEVDIENLTGSAIIDANIGDIEIYNIADSFNNLNVILQNGNAVITLPKVDCNVQYKGTKSRFSHPKKPSKDHASNFSSGSLSNGKSIIVNAKYSNVVMQ